MTVAVPTPRPWLLCLGSIAAAVTCAVLAGEAASQSPSPVIGNAMLLNGLQGAAYRQVLVAPASYNPDSGGAVRLYGLSFENDDLFETATPERAASRAFATAGHWPVTSGVARNPGATGVYTRSVEAVPNNPPIAVIRATAVLGVTGGSIVFDGLLSTEPDVELGDSITRYVWAFGDGATAEGAIHDHAFELAGQYVVSLTVTDRGGLSAQASVAVTIVENTPPSAKFSATPNPSSPGVPVRFDASESSDPETAHGDTISYQWDFDGDGWADAGGPVVMHAFETTGAHVVTLLVTDLGGLQSEATARVDIEFGIQNQTLRNALAGRPYRQQLTAGGAAGTVSWSVTNGPFSNNGAGGFTGQPGTSCAGLTLSPGGVLAGASGQPGTCGPFTISAADGTSTSTREFQFRVLPAYVYVANNASSSVSVVDPMSRTVVETIRVDGQPGGIAVSADGERVYVTLPGPLSRNDGLPAGDVGSAVVAIDTSTHTVVQTITVGQGPTRAAVSPDSRWVYVANTLDRTVSVIEAATGLVARTVETADTTPAGLAVSLDGRHIIVGGQFNLGIYTAPGLEHLAGSRLGAFGRATDVAIRSGGLPGQTDVFVTTTGATGNSLLRYVLSGQTFYLTVPTSLVADSAATALAVSPDGQLAYVASQAGVEPVDLQGARALQSPSGGGSFGVAFAADGSLAFLTQSPSMLAVVDASNHTPVDSAIFVGDEPAGVAAMPDPQLHFTTRSLPSAVVGRFYGTHNLYAAGGVWPYQYSLTAGSSLPEGLQLTADGRILGVPGELGSWAVEVVVTDADMPQQRLSQVLVIEVMPNRPPTAAFTWSPRPAPVGNVGFDASPSSDPDDAGLTFAWDLDGDGVFERNGSPVVAMFSTPGTYDVTLRATDSGGLSDEITQSVFVGSEPVASFSFVPLQPWVGDQVQFDAGLSTDPDPGGRIIRYEWDFDSDGTFEATTTSPVASWSFADGGTHDVTLRVTDSLGSLGVMTLAVVVRENRPPVIHAAYSANNPVEVGVTTSFWVDATDPDGQALTFAWDFDGDGTVDSTQQDPVHQYGSSGDKVVRITVADSMGASSSHVFAVTVVDNAAPVARAGSDLFVEASGPDGAFVTLSGSSSSDPEGEKLAYVWRDQSGAIASYSEDFEATLPVGIHTFTLTVEDGHGLTASDDINVTVIDDNRPTITVVSPADGSYPLNAVVLANFSCADAVSSVAACVGTVASGTPIDTSTAGPHTFTVTATDAAGNTSSLTVSYSVSKATPAIAWSSPAAIVYGTRLGPAQLNATVGIDGIYAYTPASGALLNAGASQTLSVTFTPTDLENYESIHASVVIDVLKATPSIALNAGTFTYDGAAHAAVAVVTGATGDILSAVAITYDGSAAAPVSVGAYSVIATFAGDANHNPASASDSLVIEPAPLTIRAEDKTMTVGSSVPLLTATYAGFVGGDSAVHLDRPVSLTTADGTTVGSFAIVASGARDPNYAITFVDGTLTVRPAQPGVCLGEPDRTVLDPVNTDGSSVFRRGSTIAVKFRACDANGVSISAPETVHAFNLVQVIDGTITTAVNEAVSSGTAFTEFRWDGASQQWIFNLTTREMAPGRTYVYRIALADQTQIGFRFGLR